MENRNIYAEISVANRDEFNIGQGSVKMLIMVFCSREIERNKADRRFSVDKCEVRRGHKNTSERLFVSI